MSEADEVEEAECPACGANGWLLGFLSYERIDGPHVESDGPDEVHAYENVTSEYSADGFRCLECGLSLDGRDEMEAVDMQGDFEREETRQAEYGEDYGND